VVREELAQEAPYARGIALIKHCQGLCVLGGHAGKELPIVVLGSRPTGGLFAYGVVLYETIVVVKRAP